MYQGNLCEGERGYLKFIFHQREEESFDVQWSRIFDVKLFYGVTVVWNME